MNFTGSDCHRVRVDTRRVTPACRSSAADPQQQRALRVKAKNHSSRETHGPARTNIWRGLVTGGSDVPVSLSCAVYAYNAVRGGAKALATRFLTIPENKTTSNVMQPLP
jgi:hypothetical protein